MNMGVGWVCEADIQSYFDTLDHSHLRGFLGEGIKGRGNKTFSACKIKNELVYILITKKTGMV